MRKHCVCVLVIAWTLQPAMSGRARFQALAATREFSCEAFPRELSEADLVARYGRENVRAAGVVGWDDGPQDGALVFPDREDLKLENIWAAPGRTISSIRARGTGGRWQSPDGIAVGMDLKTIERRNGCKAVERAPVLVRASGDAGGESARVSIANLAPLT